VEGHELYSGGHMIEAAVAYFNATGKKEFLYIACKFADLVCRVFGLEEGKCKGYPGHQEIEVALVKLYQATGNRSYLTLADYFIRQRGQEPNYLMEEYKSRQGRNFSRNLESMTISMLRFMRRFLNRRRRKGTR